MSPPIKKNIGHYQSALSALGLRSDPFAHGCGNEGYYASSALQQRIDLIRHLLDIGRQIVLVCGPAQAGKTALLDRLLEQPPPSWQVLRVTGGPMLNARSLLARIAESTGIQVADGDDHDAMIGKIRRKLIELDHGARAVILAIDDAEDIPSETQRVLVELAHGEQAAAELKIVMASKNQNAALLQNVQRDGPHAALAHVVQLPAFNAAQIRALLEHRLRAVGFRGELPLYDAAIERLRVEAEGNPGKVLVLARQLLLLKTRARRTWPTVPRRYVAYLLGAGAVLLIGVLAWFAGRGPERPASLVERELPPPAERPTTVDLTAGPAETVQSGYAEVVVDPTAGPRGADAGVAREAPAEPVAGPSSARTATQPGTTGTAAPAEMAAGSPPAEPRARPQTTPLEALPPPSAPPRERPAPVPPAKTKQALASVQTRYSIEWLMSQDRKSYVVQLFGVRDPAAAKRFVQRHELGGKTVIHTTTLDEKPWHVVLFGHYRDRDTAQAAIAKLPEELRALKPWARPLGTLGP